MSILNLVKFENFKTYNWVIVTKYIKWEASKVY